MGFYNASKWRRDRNLENSFSTVTTSSTILFLLKKGHTKFVEVWVIGRNPFTLLPKRFSKPHRAEMHQFSLILTIKHHVPSGTVSSSILYMPKTTSYSQPHNKH